MDRVQDFTQIDLPRSPEERGPEHKLFNDILPSVDQVSRAAATLEGELPHTLRFGPHTIHIARRNAPAQLGWALFEGHVGSREEDPKPLILESFF